MSDNIPGTTSASEQLTTISIEVDHDWTVNYAMQQNDVPIIKSLRLTTENESPLQDVRVSITTEPEFAHTWESRIGTVKVGETYNLGPVDLTLSHDYLASLTERVSGALHVKVFQQDTQLAHISRRIDILAFDEWNGLQSLPEILAAFTTPNHPSIESVLSDAADVIGKWTGNTSLSGYQSRDPERVALIAAAIFTALQQRTIRYINPPASFEAVGQKIRLPDRILESRLATCLDLSMLVAACLEQTGLNPLVIITTGHAFVGVWLGDETFADVATDDLLRLRKRVELGQIAVFETTLLTSEQPVTFDQAIKAGRQHLEDAAPFLCAIDIRRARKCRIRPLPLRVERLAMQSATTVNTEATEPALPLLDIPAFPSTQDEQTETAPETPATRLDRWKRKLLDLTMHNRLLNFKESKKNLPILCPDLGSLEDALADGVSFKVYPRLNDLGENNARNAEVHRQRTGANSLDEMLKEAFHSHRLHADSTDMDVSRRLLEIYREAKLSIEENGANTLYLALGFLAWYETPTSPQRRIAPIILIPLEIERRSLQEGFSIRQGDDEPMVNVTLLANLAAEFELNIRGLDPIPMDEHGIDVSLILRKFREAIIDIDQWEVLEQAYIGHFSFAKFLMWRDLEVRSEDLQRNSVVRHLIHTPSDVYPDSGTFPDPDRLDETHSPEATFCPLSADSSQLAAVHAAADGKSFVLHGPPGTGKSQTITNIIAHNLALGKTVLFVSEKRAALEVVQRRLTESGLGPFCLELHSNKSHKKAVLSQLEQTLGVPPVHSSEEWLNEAQKLANTRKELNGFVTALHTIRPSGESLFVGLSQLIKNRNIPLVSLSWPSVEQIDRQKLDALRDTARRLQLAAGQIGHPIANCWEAAQCEIWTPELRNSVERVLNEMKGAIESLTGTTKEIAAIVGMPANDWSSQDLQHLAEIADALLDCPSLPQGLLVTNEWEESKAAIAETVAHGRQRDELREKLFSRYTQGVLTMDTGALCQQWSAAEQSWFLPRWLGCRKIRQALTSVACTGYLPQNPDVVHDLQLAQAVQQEEQYLKAQSAVIELLGGLWRNGEAKWCDIEEDVSRADALRKVALNVAGIDIDLALHLRHRWAKLVAEGRDQLAGTAPIGQHLQAYQEAYSRFTSILSALTTLLNLGAITTRTDAAPQGFLATLVERSELWLENLNGLKPWCHWRSVRSEGKALNLEPIIDAYESQGLATEKLQDAFERGYYQWWCDTIISGAPILSGFFSSDFEDKIQQFRLTDDRYTRLTRQEIQARVSARLPRGQVDNPNSEMGLLRRQIQRQRGHLPLRALLQKLPNLLPRLKPCLLMSPISVAQYLDPAHPPFDLVVFDEASQIPVWDAVGAMARGKEVIIVGDPKQLPPTNFFSRADTGDGADADDSLVEDLESILDDCIAAQLPERHLNWHYRSRHESLIAFSNYHYYGNRLLTFPSPHQELGVSFRPVTGEYDKGKSRTNKTEAKAVVDEVLRRLCDPELCRFSIGIVTFSLAQQLLVDDLLEEARRQHPEIEPHFSDGSAEPVFIKNLENVQGDERDVILFSICYGPDAVGRVSMNFGPINRDGGERRLNVAVTRARQEVIVFSTLRAEQIDLSRSRAQGVADLKCFLDYAERGTVAIAERQASDPAGECESPFEEQVCDALRDKGYIVHPQVGCSGYRIDLAIVDPDKPGRYLLGIECDGANYHRSKTARDRDKLRESILRGLGWNLHRIWSTDWWEKPAEELVRIEEAIETAKQTSQQPDVVAESQPQWIAVAPVLPMTEPLKSQAPLSQEPTFPVYETFTFKGINGTPEDFHLQTGDSTICALIEAVVSKEGPVSLGLVARRVAEHWGISRVTSRALTRVAGLAKKANVRMITEEDKVFLWQTFLDPKSFTGFRIPGADEDAKRAAEDLPQAEVANAAQYLLEQHVSLPVADLVRETARLFGYQRIGQNVDKAIRGGIKWLVISGRAKEEDGVIIHQPNNK
ncbi:DUF3320 domain-containing protein [Oryzomonas rubra]|uniref:DUF3320 domain-containing protein n=1 Tax=Oryzomonas rubra TaxID=2509454 RepID=A0A5A9X4Z1_9BACT|nr:DUF3320 domain-containing protein [Oryzomonas rubra]KAA0888137.1 DUF3320 domain-containing protein [Oryzomonas rubra]